MITNIDYANKENIRVQNFSLAPSIIETLENIHVHNTHFQKAGALISPGNSLCLFWYKSWPINLITYYYSSPSTVQFKKCYLIKFAKRKEISIWHVRYSRRSIGSALKHMSKKFIKQFNLFLKSFRKMNLTVINHI